MLYYLTKVAITTILIVVISEVAKRSSLIGAILASIPLVSVLAMIWLYVDTRDISKVSDLSRSVFWLVLPSLTLFLALPWLLKSGVDFYWSMIIAIALTVFMYWLMVMVLGRFDVRL